MLASQGGLLHCGVGEAPGCVSHLRGAFWERLVVLQGMLGHKCHFSEQSGPAAASRMPHENSISQTICGDTGGSGALAGPLRRVTQRHFWFAMGVPRSHPGGALRVASMEVQMPGPLPSIWPPCWVSVIDVVPFLSCSKWNPKSLGPKPLPLIRVVET